ncbi:MAG: DUF2147 domain-containing protein [Oceanihabitans sp.]
MNKCYFLILFLGVLMNASAQDIFGKWKTIDDQTGEAKSIVEIYKQEGKIYGKIVALLREQDKNALCYNCEGKEYNQPVLGLQLIKNMTKDGKYYKNGSIFDPENGKKYKCRLALTTKNSNILEVRGYIAFFYATQYWIRVE